MPKIIKHHFLLTAVVLAMAVFFVTDRFLKSLALTMETGHFQTLVGSLLTFQFTANYQAAFSLPLAATWLKVIGATVILALLSYIIYLIKNKDRADQLLPTGLILLGAISNYYDRLAYGYVIDYWALKYFTVFNLADVMISWGALWLIWRTIKRS